MEKAVSSGFQFKNFFIDESYIRISEGAKEDLKLEIQPSGTHFKNTNNFRLILVVSIKDKDGNFECRIVSRGEFVFNNADENLLDYFCLNAPAIIFPYIRAYISTLTNLSTAGHPITLPTMKLSLKETLKSNIVVVD
jgi:preprotein translocase subunit SecB